MLQIIANENAGNGTGRRTLPKVQALLAARGVAFETRTTQGPGDATKLAKEAIDRGITEIVCLGGDGTDFEIVNGLAGRFATLYFVPCGTGNDFSKMFARPEDPVEALAAQLDGERRRIDLGRIAMSRNDGAQKREIYFLNVSGSGFDVEVLIQAARFKRMGKGLIPYLMGLIAALRKFRPMHIETEINGKKEEKDVTIFSVGNGSFIGGGMKAVPGAKTDDGLFDVVIADAMSKGAILKFLGKFIKGKHIGLKEIHTLQCERMTVRCPGMTIDADGELIPADEARFEILPGAVEVRMPAKTGN